MSEYVNSLHVSGIWSVKSFMQEPYVMAFGTCRLACIKKIQVSNDKGNKTGLESLLIVTTTFGHVICVVTNPCPLRVVGGC